MNKLLLICGAAIGALLFSRRDRLNDDAKAVQTAAKDGVSKINSRVRPNKDDPEAMEDAVLDLDEAPAEDAESPSTPADAT
jgi:hypothetical protein